MDNDILSQLVSDYGIMPTNEHAIYASKLPNMTRPTGFSADLNPHIFVDPYDPTLDTPTPGEDTLGNLNSLDELDSLELENVLADIADQNIQQLPEISSQKSIDPYLKILEEPGDTRFRFKTEGRGTLNGLNSTKEIKTNPTVQIVGYQGPAKVLISCVEDSIPYRAHPHQLIGKGECKDGVCIVSVDSMEQPIVFQNLGIARVRVKEIKESLSTRENLKIDPFNQGFDLKTTAKNISLHQIRLCFQAYLGTKETGFKVLRPVVSRIVRNKEPNSELQITNYSDNTSPVTGGKKIMLFCGKIHRDDIEVRFELSIKDGNKVTLKGTFNPEDVHKHCAIAFKTPPYFDRTIVQPVKVDMILYKPSDRTSSDPIEFWYIPESSNNVHIENSNFKYPQELPKQIQNTPLKRPKERAFEGEESTGHIHIPPTRIKSEPEQPSRVHSEAKSNFDRPLASQMEPKGSFIEQIERYANAFQAEKNATTDNQIPVDTHTTIPRLGEVLGVPTAEIVDIVKNINPEEIEGLSAQISNSLNF